MKTSKTFISLIVAAIALGTLSACGNVSQGIATNGAHADSLVWPDQGAVSSLHKGGTFPNEENLKRVKTGLNQQQIADLVGFPHFNEGFGAREWNYLFKFRDPATDAIATCQFKVLFDADGLAGSFYWMPATCAQFQNAQPAAQAVAPQVQSSVRVDDQPVPTTFSLSSDALFAFDSASFVDINAKGMSRLSAYASDVKAHRAQLQNVRIVGYTDRLGSDMYNNDLSKRRALAVKAYLVEQGFPADVIQAVGMGKANPVQDCNGVGRGKDLVACLAPNRRVVIETVFSGT